MWYNLTENLKFSHYLLKISFILNILTYPGYSIFTTLVTRVVQRGKSETKLITAINALRKAVKSENVNVNNGGQLYEKANKINISEFIFKTHPNYYLERCFFGNYNCIYDWKFVGTRV